MAKRKKKVRTRFFLLGLTSIFIICAVTFTIGKYWIEIIDKYQEKKNLDRELTSMKEKEEEQKNETGGCPSCFTYI